jgi:hypothetical protein
MLSFSVSFFSNQPKLFNDSLKSMLFNGDSLYFQRQLFQTQYFQRQLFGDSFFGDSFLSNF